MTGFNTIPPTSRMSRLSRREGVILDSWSANRRLAKRAFWELPLSWPTLNGS